MLDASALLALVREERGGDAVEERGLQIPVLPITQREAEASPDLCHLAWENGISMGDRLGLATCLTHNLIAVTSEQNENWPDDKGVTIRRIR